MSISYNAVLITKLLSLFIIFLLLFLFNVEVDIDGFYLLGGSNTDCSMGVAGVFELEFLVLLFLVDIILILMLIWSVKHPKYLLIMSLVNLILLVLAIYLKQPRLFKGYELTHHTNLLDALTGKCYLFYGVHDGVLALTIFLNVAMIVWYYNQAQNIYDKHNIL